MKIREMSPEEYPLLEQFLYLAVFVPEGMTAPLASIIYEPALYRSIADFGRHRGDFCCVAEIQGRIVGAAWARTIEQYGSLGAGIPSLCISVVPEHRNQGIGTAMIGRILETLQKEGFDKASLSVQKENPAIKLYQRAGFTLVREKEEEWIMVYDL